MSTEHVPDPRHAPLLQVIEEYFAYHEQAGRPAAATLNNYRNGNRRYAHWLGEDSTVASMTARSVEAFCASVPKSSVRMMVSSIRHFSYWLCKRGWLDGSPALYVPLPPRGRSTRQPVPDDVITQLLAACDRLPESPLIRAKSRAILSVLAYAGLRSSQLLSLKVQDVDFREGCLRFWNTKSKRHQVIYPCEECMEALKLYVALRPSVAPYDALWCYNVKRPMAEEGLRKLLRRVCVVGGFRGEKITPHMFRHSFASRLIKNGASMVAIQEALGHSNLATTAIYLHFDSSQMKNLAPMTAINQAALSSSPAPSSPQKVSSLSAEQPEATGRSRNGLHRHRVLNRS